jgi:hypothetical protein
LTALALIWVLDLGGAVPSHLPGMIAATLAGLLSLGAAVVLYARRPVPATLRAAFIIQALGVVGLGTGWLAAAAF